MTRPEPSESRRLQVATALLRVVGHEGLEAASLARVAEEAGISVGLIQRHFRTKDELLVFAFDHLYAETLSRVAAVGPRGRVRDRLVEGLAALLPLGEERVLEGRVWLAYIARASVDPGFGAAHARGMAVIRVACADAIRAAQEAGEAHAGLDAEVEAVPLAALVDGLIVDLLGDPTAISDETAVAALGSYVDRLFSAGPSTENTGNLR